MTRDFTIEKAVRKSVPLLVGLMGPSGGGKTYSALRLARGIQKVFPGDIIHIDTESNRALHYASAFDFHHIPFGEPFGSKDYLEVLNFAASKKPSVIIVDSMSHEHEGPGGLLDLHDQETTRMAGDDYQKRQRVQMLAWQKPKAERRKLINGLLQMNSNFIFCFRAKESSRPVKKNGKTEIENFGFVPIAGDEFVFEMTINMLLLPHANGHPTWDTDNKGEKMMMKLPEQFKSLFSGDIQLTEEIGEKLAQWAKGDIKKKEPPKELETLKTLTNVPDVFKERVQKAIEYIGNKGMTVTARKSYDELMKDIAGYKDTAEENVEKQEVEKKEDEKEHGKKKSSENKPAGPVDLF